VGISLLEDDAVHGDCILVPSGHLGFTIAYVYCFQIIGSVLPVYLHISVFELFFTVYEFDRIVKPITRKECYALFSSTDIQEFLLYKTFFVHQVVIMSEETVLISQFVDVLQAMV